MKKFILIVWQLPQMVLGLFVILFSKAKKIDGEDYKGFWSTSCKFGVSLGEIRIINNSTNERTLRHEFGHTRQSRRFGPLYLFVVGIPSIIRNVYDMVAHKKWRYADRFKWYYSSWPEKQADILGGLNPVSKD